MAVNLQGQIIDEAGNPTGGQVNVKTGEVSSIPVSDLSEAQTPLTVSTPAYSFPYDPTKLDSTPPLTMTPEEEKAQGLSEEVGKLYEGLTGETAFRAEQEKAQGIPELQKTQTDLSARLKALQNEALQIPLQLQQEAEGRGITAGGLRPIETAALRKNAIAALGVGSLLEASRGNLTLAMDLVDRAVSQRFDPIREEIAAKMANLQLILQSPKYSLEQKNRAQKQLDIQNKRDREINKQSEYFKIAQSMANAAVVNNPGNQLANLAAQRVLNLDPADPQYLAKVFEFVGQYQVDPIKTQKDLFDLENSKLQLEKLTQEIEKIRLENKAVVPGQFDITTKSGQLAAIAQNLTSKYGTKFQQQAFLGNVQRLAGSGDNQQLADYIMSEAIGQLPDSETRKRAVGNYILTQKLVHLDNLFKDYVSRNGNTNIFRGTKENIIQRLGFVRDPELRAIGTEIADTVDQLARTRTGAVINDSEEKLYKSLLPGIGKTLALNEATISGLLDSLMTDYNSALKFQLTGTGVNAVKDYFDINYQAPGAVDKFSGLRAQLYPGEILVNRNGEAVAITPEELLPTDIEL